MRIISKRRLVEFRETYAEARQWLESWYKLAQAAQWEDITEVRRAFPHADPVSVGSGKTATVFNVCGNKYRLITAIHYASRIVFVLMLLRHAEYSTGRWKERP